MGFVQFQQFGVGRRRGRTDGRVLFLGDRITVHRGDHATRFGEDDASCGKIPRPQDQFEKAVYAAAGGVAQIECRRAGAADIQTLIKDLFRQREGIPLIFQIVR